MELVIAIAILIITLILGVPIPACFGAAVIFIVTTMGHVSASLIPVGFSKLNAIVLLAIPLFILAGGIIEKGKIGKALVEFVELFVGGIRGSLGIVTVVSCAIFGAISGSAAATLSCIGSIMYPKLKEAKYDEGFAAALIANASPLGLLIPPSSIQILYAWSTGQSVLACFLATVIPGVILVISLSIVNVYFSRKNPDMNKVYIETMTQPKSTKLEIRHRIVYAIPALLMPIIILGGIYAGIMTPTEAAAVAVIYAIPIGMFIYKGLNLKGLKDSLVETGTTTGVVMVMFFVVMILSRLFVLENLPTKMADLMMGITENKYIILLFINLFMVIIGMLMDDVSGTLLCAPVLLPLVVALGVSPIQFAAILGVNLGMGNITPPTAPLLYLGGRVSNVRINKMLSPSIIMIIFAWLPTLLLTTYFSELSLFLPRLFGLV
ncbi:MAG: TRAP transporter large permease [Bacillota bacterium]